MGKNSISKLGILLAIMLLAACGPTEEELAGTSQAEKTRSYNATQTAKPTFTLEPTATFTPLPSATPTSTTIPTSSPTSTPTPTQSLTPTPEMAMVYGNLQLTLIPYNDEAIVPESLGDISLIIKLVSGEEEYSTQVTEPEGDYFLPLPAGTYNISELVISEIGDYEVEIWSYMGKPIIHVPEEGCIYVGRLVLSYDRLPPVAINEQVALVQKIMQGHDAIFTIDTNGSLVLETISVDLPDQNERVKGSEECEIELADLVNPYDD